MGGIDRARFTVVEMMIAVAIVMILASLAVPGVQLMAMKAKRAEVPVNVDGIHTNAVAYEAAYGLYANGFVFVPTPVPGKAPVPWPSGTYFDGLEWRPDGDVRGQYATGTGTLAICVTALGWTGPDVLFESGGRSDIDEDGTNYFYVCCDGTGSRMHEAICLVKPGREGDY